MDNQEDTNAQEETGVHASPEAVEGQPIKVTSQDVEDAIVDYDTRTVELVGKPHTVTAVRMKNGFTIVEASTCADISNYDEGIGERVNTENIRNKIWLLLGYERQSVLADQKDATKLDLLRVIQSMLTSVIEGESIATYELREAVDLIDEVVGGGAGYQSCVRIELKELSSRIEKLEAFRRSERFTALPEGEQKRLYSQLEFMWSYRAVLAARIANFQA